METSILCPPNHPPSKNDMLNSAIGYENLHYQRGSNERWQTKHRTSTKTLQHQVLETGKQKRSKPTMNGSTKQAQKLDATESGMNIPLKQGTSYEEITQLIRLGHEIQRKQCGENQRRFRQRQNDWILDMEISTQKLHAEIYALELRRSRVAAAVIDANKLWNVAVRYLEVFRDGLAPSSNFAGEPATQFDKQLEFVQTAMTPTVVCYAGYGPEAIMRSWSFSQLFDDVKVEIEKLEEVNNSVVAFTRTSVTFTSQTIRTLFPHLCCTTRGSTSPNWGNRLVGQRIVMRGSTYFEWDGGSNRVSRVMTHSDMMTPMLRILGSLETVDLVFESARVCPNFQMR